MAAGQGRRFWNDTGGSRDLSSDSGGSKFRDSSSDSSNQAKTSSGRRFQNDETSFGGQTSGILELQVESRYYSLMKIITRSDIDLIGFYYQLEGTTNLILYDAYTGKSIGSHTITLDQVYRDVNVRKVILHPLKDISKKFRLAVSRLLTKRLTSGESIQIETFKRHLKNLILHSVGIETDPHYGGIYIINQILYALDNLDYSSYKKESVIHMVSSDHLGPPIVKELAAGNTQPYIGVDSIEQFDLLVSVLRNLYLDNDEFRDRAADRFRGLESGAGIEISIAPSVAYDVESDDSVDNFNSDERGSVYTGPESSRSMPNTSPNKNLIPNILTAEDHLFNSLIRSDGGLESNLFRLNQLRQDAGFDDLVVPAVFSKMAIIHQRLSQIRGLVGQMIQDIHDQTPPVIHMSKLVGDLNVVLKEVGLDALNGNLDSGSYGALVHIGHDGLLHEEQAVIRLVCGDSLILPIRGADLSSFEIETLRDILHYLDTLIEIDNRYVPLQMLVTRELALRKRGSQN